MFLWKNGAIHCCELMRAAPLTLRFSSPLLKEPSIEARGPGTLAGKDD